MIKKIIDDTPKQEPIGDRDCLSVVISKGDSKKLNEKCKELSISKSALIRSFIKEFLVAPVKYTDNTGARAARFIV